MRLRDFRIFKQIPFIILSLLAFSGCIAINNQDRLDKPSIVENTQHAKKQLAHCNQNIKLMNYAFTYVLNEFEKGYFEKKDILGANAQLFLIENKSKSVFAQNINAAEKAYNLQYEKLRNKKCSVSKFTVSPLQNIKNRISELDTNNETVISK